MTRLGRTPISIHGQGERPSQQPELPGNASATSCTAALVLRGRKSNDLLADTQ